MHDISPCSRIPVEIPDVRIQISITSTPHLIVFSDPHGSCERVSVVPLEQDTEIKLIESRPAGYVDGSWTGHLMAIGAG
jgi:hypothetical protein